MEAHARRLSLEDTEAQLPVGTDLLLTSKESAVYARRVSANGLISSGWRSILRALVDQGLAFRQGDSPQAEILVRKSVVDEVIEGRLRL